MKKATLIFILLIVCGLNSFARKVTLVIHNKSNFKIYYATDFYTYMHLKESHDEFLSPISEGYFDGVYGSGPAQHIESNTEFPVKSTIRYYTHNSDFGIGVEGRVRFYAVNNDGTKYFFVFNFNNPCIGSNEFSASGDYPFELRHVSGGDGNEAVVEYEITGGPSPIPPPPPVPLANYGSRVITGVIEWNESKCGKPNINDLTKIVSIKASAPVLFRQTVSGVGSDVYKGKRGYFDGRRNVGNVEITMPKYMGTQLNSMSNNQQQKAADQITLINYKVYNLPNDIPVDIAVEQLAEWTPGPLAPPKPNKQSEKYFTYAWDKRKTARGIDYEISGAWMYADANGNPTTGDGTAASLMKKLKNKTSFQNTDIFFDNNGINESRAGLNQFELNKTGIKSSGVQISKDKNAQTIPTGVQQKNALPSQQKINVQQINTIKKQ